MYRNASTLHHEGAFCNTGTTSEWQIKDVGPKFIRIGPEICNTGPVSGPVVKYHGPEICTGPVSKRQ